MELIDVHLEVFETGGRTLLFGGLGRTGGRTPGCVCLMNEECNIHGDERRGTILHFFQMLHFSLLRGKNNLHVLHEKERFDGMLYCRFIVIFTFEEGVFQDNGREVENVTCLVGESSESVKLADPSGQQYLL